MKSAIDAVRPEIRALKPYAAPAAGAGGARGAASDVPLIAGAAADGPPILKLDFNESPYDVPAEIKSVVLSHLAARRWSLYPEQGNPRLREAIARSIGRAPDEIAVGNGSGELILAGISVLAGGGGTILLAPPTFSLYRLMATISGARVELVPRIGAELDVDVEALLARTRATGGVPIVCSPNNPTGGVVSRDAIRSLAAAAPVVLLDQAYVDFADEADDGLPLLDEVPNLVIFRTLSKAFSAAGFRIGYVVARAELLREIEKGYLPYSVDWAAEELALALFARPELSRGAVASLSAERERVGEALRGIGLHVPRSRGNFLFFAAPDGDGTGLFERLLARGIRVRDLSATQAGHIRVSIGTREQNEEFLASLKEVL